MKTSTLGNRLTGQTGLKVLIGLMGPILVSAATISEPATTFYGKVLGTADVQPFLITEGRLTWVIRRADGVDVTLRASLFAYGGGTFSYRLDVPHAALSLGQTAAAGNVPLALAEQTHRHLSVTLDGAPVALLGPAGSTFTAAQLLRSATYRLDLGVDRQAPDSDGDGLPDWWEDLYGLDKQANDAGQSFGVGGLTAAQCYERGLDPNADHTVPSLQTAETVVYAGGDTALILEAADLDTPASNLVYTVTALPYGTLLNLKSEISNPQLEIGSTFTQADVLAARLIYRHDPEIPDPGVLGLTLSDDRHGPVAADVRLLLYEPAIDEVSLRSDLYQFANAGFVVAEGDTIDASDAVVSYALAGSVLSAGSANDVLIHTSSLTTQHASLSGGPGADRFILSGSAGDVHIADFNIAEGDVLDITAFAPASGTLSDHVALVGDALVFDTGLVVALEGLGATDLYALVGAGALLTDLPLAARVSIAATVPTAYRNGKVPGLFTVARQGDVSQAVAVNLSVYGSAAGGTDYETILNTVVIPAGAASAGIPVVPYESGGTLPVEVSVRLLAGSGYVLGAAQTAGVTIEPRKAQVFVDALLPVAAQESAESGFFLVWRDTAGAALTVQNTLGGDAVRNIDYVTYNYDTGAAINPALLLFGANETEKLIEVAVKPSADLSAGPKTVTLAPVPSTRYVIDPESAFAQIALIERYDTFTAWLARAEPQTLEVTLGLADGEPADTALLFKRYAFGSDPQGTDVSGFPRPYVLADGLTVRVRQRIGLLDVSYGVRGFTDLRDPAGSAVGVTPVPAPEGEPAGPEWRYYRLDADGPRGFISVDLEN